MQAVVARQVLSPVLLPGAAGRTDDFVRARTSAVAALAALLDDAGLGAGETASAPGLPPVLVVAPARWSRVAVDALPDLASLGLDAPRPLGTGHADERSPRLDVTATVTVTLLRLAGWLGHVETVEVAEPRGDVVAADLDTVVAAALDGRRLVLLALGSDELELPAGARPALAAGHARVRALADQMALAAVAP